MPEPEMNTPSDPPPDRRSPFEWSLAALRPADADVARPSFMFKAGQASRQKAVWFWRCVAGGLVVVIVAGGLAGFGLVQAELQRAAALIAQAEMRAVPATAARAEVESTPAPSEPSSPPTLITTQPAITSLPPVEQTSASEIASALERRRNILAGGLGLIPDAPPTFRPDSPGTVPTYPGVFAAPRVEKKPLTESDPEPIEPR